MRHSRGQQGFSLVEAIVYIVVMGVLLAALVVAFASPLRQSPIAGQIDLATELAQQRMELIVAQRRAVGFAGFTDPCVPGPGPAQCTPPGGYTVTSAIVTGWGGDPANYKVVTVTVAGTGATSMSALMANY